MGLRIKRQRNLPIGVDLGTSSLKMAQLRAGDGRVELLAAASAELGDSGGDAGARLGLQADRARDLLKSSGFKGRQVILSLPASAVFLQPVRTPALPPGEVDTAVRQELQERLPYPLEEAIIRHVLAGPVYGEREKLQERIVVSARRGELEGYVSAARRAGLDVVGVSAEACALVSCFSRLFRRASDESRITLFIDIGWASTQVVLMRGQKMIFASNLAAGGRSLDAAVAGALRIAPEKARTIRRQASGDAAGEAAAADLLKLLEGQIAGMAATINHCLRYYESTFGSHPVERVVFIGGQAHDRRLCQAVAERLNLPAQVGDPMAGIRRRSGGGPDARSPQPAWAVAVGLSLGAAEAA